MERTKETLEARVQELEGITKVICGHCCEPMEIPSKAVLQSQLTQRTAERDTARRRVDELEAREIDVVMLREDLEQRTAIAPEGETAKGWLKFVIESPMTDRSFEDKALCQSCLADIDVQRKGKR